MDTPEPEYNGDQEPKDTGVEETHFEPEAPAEPEPTHKVVEVTCGKCGSGFALPIERNVTAFYFNCTNCGARNTVEDIE